MIEQVLRSPAALALLLAATLTLAIPTRAAADDFTPMVQLAITTYRAALDEPERNARLDRFSKAAQLFRQAAQLQVTESDQLPSASLWTNAGNASLQAEDLGHAILAYRRALEIDPANSVAQTNLRIARQQLPQHLQPQRDTSIWSTLFFWNEIFAGRAATWAACCFAIAAIFWAISIRFNKPLARNLAVVPLTLWGALLLSAFVSAQRDKSAGAVLIEGDVTARTADSKNAPPQFSSPLVAGVEVSIIQNRLDWVQAMLPSGDKTWLPASSVELILRC